MSLEQKLTKRIVRNHISSEVFIGLMFISMITLTLGLAYAVQETVLCSLVAFVISAGASFICERRVDFYSKSLEHAKKREERRRYNKPIRLRMVAP